MLRRTERRLSDSPKGEDEFDARIGRHDRSGDGALPTGELEEDTSVSTSRVR